MLIRGIANFYGIRIDTYIENNITNNNTNTEHTIEINTKLSSQKQKSKSKSNTIKILHLYVPPSITKASKIERTAVSMVRQQLAEVWKQDIEVLRTNNQTNNNTSNSNNSTTETNNTNTSTAPVSSILPIPTQEHETIIKNDELHSTTAAPSSINASSSSIDTIPLSPINTEIDKLNTVMEPLVPLYALHIRTIDNNQRMLSKKFNPLTNNKTKFSYGKQYLPRDNQDPNEEIHQYEENKNKNILNDIIIKQNRNGSVRTNSTQTTSTMDTTFMKNLKK